MEAKINNNYNEELKNRAYDLLHTDWTIINPTRIILKNVGIIDYFKTAGYWAAIQQPPEFSMHDDSTYSWPKENTFNTIDKEHFLPKLAAVERAITSHTIKHSMFRHFAGISQCRCCKKNNGSGEYFYQGWKWPEGYFHYLEAHNVEPTASFMVFIHITYDQFFNSNNKRNR